MQITVNNLHNKYKINAPLVKKISLKVLRMLKKSGALELEIVFLDDKNMAPLNKKYRGRARSTDVLSFCMEKKDRSGALVGSVVISLDTALKNSKIFKTVFEEEIVLYIIHGILHLFGYDDEDTDSFRRMSRKQFNILEKICRRERLSTVLMRQ